MSSDIVSIQWMEPLFLPRGWHRSPIGRWLLVDAVGRPLALVARLTTGRAWSWRSVMFVHRGHWWCSAVPEPFDLTLERACKALREPGAGQVSEQLEEQIFTLWTMETPHAHAPEHVVG